jgi:hypothetical protein
MRSVLKVKGCADIIFSAKRIIGAKVGNVGLEGAEKL